MNLSVDWRGRTMIVRVMENRIDAAVAILFKDAMREMVAMPSDRIILDLSQVTFLDSSGLGAVVAVMKLMDAGRPLEIAGLTPTVEKVFRLTRMDRVFTIHPTARAGDDDAR